jgi:photosystem II stability/assembly factor-like uncharacterized protein
MSPEGPFVTDDNGRSEHDLRQALRSLQPAIVDVDTAWNEHLRRSGAKPDRHGIPRRLSGLPYAIGFAAAIVAIGVVAVIGSVEAVHSSGARPAGHHTGTTVSSTLPPVGITTPVQSNQIVGADGDFWMLGTFPCSTRKTCIEIVRSTNAGTTFVRVGAPAVRLDPTNLDLNLQFANADDGYLTVDQVDAAGKGSEVLFWTNDGGVSWRLVDPGGGVTTPIVTTEGRAYAIVSTCKANTVEGSCNSFRLASSSVTSNVWQTHPLPIATETASTTIAAFGSKVWLAIVPYRSGSLRLLVSEDGGRSFSDLPVTDESALICQMTATSPTTLWGFCDTGNEGYGVRSDDGGVQFSGVNAPANPSNAARIIALSNTEAVYSIPLSPDIWLTTDGGSSFRSVFNGPSPAMGMQVGFASATTWILIQNLPAGQELWRTTNSGRSWTRIGLLAVK